MPPQKKNSAEPGSPIGQRHLLSLNSSSEQRWPIGMMFSISSGSGSTSDSYIGASAVLPRIDGRDSRIIWPGARALRGRGAVEEGLLARPDSPSRCTLPITALRVMPPSSAAIWLADSPSVHNFLRSSTRSSVHIILSLPLFGRADERTASTESLSLLRQREVAVGYAGTGDKNLGNGPPHEIS